MPTGMPITTNIPQRMDRLPWARWHWLVVGALGITWLLDGLEVSIVASLGPTLTHPDALHLTQSEVGLTVSAYLTGSGQYVVINSAIDELIPARDRAHIDLTINGS